MKRELERRWAHNDKNYFHRNFITGNRFVIPPYHWLWQTTTSYFVGRSSGRISRKVWTTRRRCLGSSRKLNYMPGMFPESTIRNKRRENRSPSRYDKNRHRSRYVLKNFFQKNLSHLSVGCVGWPRYFEGKNKTTISTGPNFTGISSGFLLGP